MSPGPYDMDAPDPRAERETKEAKGIMVLVILAVMLFAVVGSLDWYENAERADLFGGMAQDMFTLHLIPFEMLGFLLLAALIGALYIANKEGTRR